MARVKAKKTKSQKRETRLQKAALWLPSYEGLHLVRAYRKKFNVDYICALNDLEMLNAITPEKLAHLRQCEEIRRKRLREEKEAKEEREFYERWPDSNDTFFYIAGYTSNGIPYGITWEEMGLEPYEILE